MSHFSVISSGLPENFESRDFKAPAEVPCIIQLLRDKHEGLLIEAKGIKEHWWKPYIKKLFDRKVSKTPCNEGLQICQGESWLTSCNFCDCVLLVFAFLLVKRYKYFRKKKNQRTCKWVLFVFMPSVDAFVVISGCVLV